MGGVVWSGYEDCVIRSRHTHKQVKALHHVTYSCNALDVDVPHTCSMDVAASCTMLW